MRIKYNRQDLAVSYEKIVRSAEKSYQHHHLLKALDLIQLAAHFQYIFVDRYADRRLDNLIRKISSELITPKVSSSFDENTILFFDHFGKDNQGLTQQYLDAVFLQPDVRVVYVFERTADSRSEKIKQLLLSKNSIVIELGGDSLQNKIHRLQCVVEEYRPGKAFFHLSPSSTLPFVVFNAYPNIIKYQINLTDHSFWLGDSDFFNFCFEFRDYGCEVSEHKRGFNKKQLLLLPYYPWCEELPFEGFPVDTYGKVILFSGCYMYKIQDEKNTFFHIVRRILEANKTAIMLFAGDGDNTQLKELIGEYGLQERFVLLGHRHDILEVFKHIDIFINTYPLGGGLMSQYAALCGKPILSYRSRVEGVVCTRKKANFVFDNIDDLLQEANRLIVDSDYRAQRSSFFESLIAGPHIFRERFSRYFLTNESVYYERVAIDYDDFCQGYVRRLNLSENVHEEAMILKKCPHALGYKMVINLILGSMPVIKRRLKLWYHC